MADTYSGQVRILDDNGVLLAVGTAKLGYEEAVDNWAGEIEVVAGGAVSGKALVVHLEIEGNRGRAQLRPIDNRGVMAHLAVVGLGPQPF
jgi:hypothetical protein